MAKQKEIYKCEVCGNVVEVLYGGLGELFCCGKPMALFEEKTEDGGQEKHVPIIQENEEGKVMVKVGENEHPMTEEHYFEWMELTCDVRSFKYFLKPGDKPEVGFTVGGCKDIRARAYCNLHGLWKSSTNP